MKTNLAKKLPPAPASITHLPHKNILKNELIVSPQLECKNTIQEQIHNLYRDIQKIPAAENKQTNAFEIAKIYDQAVEVFLALDDIKSAREICYSQIHLFILWSYQFKEASLFKYALTPWLNLARIDRLEGFFDEAVSKLSTLNISDKLKDDHKVWINQLVHDIIHSNNEVKQSIKVACLLERIKIFLSEKNYLSLIAFLKTEFLGAEIKHPIIQEALAIAYANTGRFFKALDLLAWAKSSADTFSAQVFFLRECEIKSMLRKNIFTDVHLLYSQTLTFLNKKPTDQHIKFGLHTVYVLNKANFKEEAAQLAYFCLRTAVTSSNELLKAESLILLNELITEYEGRNLIENLMIKHYFQTQHMIARKKMLKEFQGLQYVETNNAKELADLLLEKLLSFVTECFA